MLPCGVNARDYHSPEDRSWLPHLWPAGIESPHTPLYVQVPEQDISVVAGRGQEVGVLACQAEDVFTMLPGTKVLGNRALWFPGIAVWEPGNENVKSCQMPTCDVELHKLELLWLPVCGEQLAPPTNNDPLLQETDRRHLGAWRNDTLTGRMRE